MKRFFDAELENFRSHLLQMGERAMDQTRLAMKSLAEADIALADKVIAADDELDRLEVQIDDEAIRYMMLRDALDCFVQEDEQKALSVIRRDPEVDNLNRLLYRRLTSYMIERPDTIARALELMLISK